MDYLHVFCTVKVSTTLSTTLVVPFVYVYTIMDVRAVLVFARDIDHERTFKVATLNQDT